VSTFSSVLPVSATIPPDVAMKSISQSVLILGPTSYSREGATKTVSLVGWQSRR
jgi:hypothetical protein